MRLDAAEPHSPKLLKNGSMGIFKGVEKETLRVDFVDFVSVLFWESVHSLTGQNPRQSFWKKKYINTKKGNIYSE